MLSFFEPCQGKSHVWANFFRAQLRDGYLARKGKPLAHLEFTTPCLFLERRKFAPAGDQVGEYRDHARGRRTLSRSLQVFETFVWQT